MFSPSTRGRGFVAGVLVVIVFILSACGAAESPADSNATESESNPQPIQLTISAAASLKSALDEAGELFETQYPHITLRYNYGGSGALAQQLEQGAPVDLFISAANAPMDRLIDKGIVDADAVQLMLRNSLVLIESAASNDLSQLQDLLKPNVRIVAIGEVDTVPAGEYAKEALQNEGLWEEVETKAVYGKDVTQVLAYVESGNADAGFVYSTDIQHSTKVRQVITIDPDKHRPIEYPAAVPNQASHPDEASRFLEFMNMPEVEQIFSQAGFIIVEESGSQ
ncbi:molybdate ABC transporter substrate-binding protein [Paenibacillus sp. JCM 10914]|uniref:molybdate ABC transporter substrate-binding protein n=1 Tax=Paenibacillus sp. JCM 10914 TaxID=1236974 RepID=UPI0003CC644F|nr:molybdate ABC transporter substrate-binding protein [Paenibacillus sp. JCM 10914]GAE05705.1 molybdenum ABC transporter, periplasmic molybdenum-binding protein ModA [Paenibacillus sp. JCM 10914]